jgi:hypothetical protein
MTKEKAERQKQGLKIEAPSAEVKTEIHGAEYILVAYEPLVSPAPFQELTNIADVDGYILRYKRRYS